MGDVNAHRALSPYPDTIDATTSWDRAWSRTVRRGSPLRRRALLPSLAAVTVLVGAATLWWPDVVPFTVLVLPVLLAGSLLGPREIPWFVGLAGVVLVLALLREGWMSPQTLLQGGVVAAAGVLVALAARRRARLGVAGTRGEDMLVDLRDRIQRQGTLPTLPRGWYAESAVRSAEGTAFAGDFLVAGEAAGGHCLEVAVGDVTGKGAAAGTRSLLLTGAFGGLLGASPPAQFLPHCNDYLLRQGWAEHFATAVHLCLDLTDGSFVLRSAGHPPAVHFTAGSGRWLPLEASGPPLGVAPGADFPAVTGRLRRGDAMLLYTDGLVEAHGRDIDTGIDRLLGLAERLLHRGFERGAQRLIEAAGSEEDDRALLLIHRWA